MDRSENLVRSVTIVLPKTADTRHEAEERTRLVLQPVSSKTAWRTLFGGTQIQTGLGTLAVGNGGRHFEQHYAT